MHIPSEQAIRERAYQLWENDGRPDGRSVDYWLEAARQLEDEGAPAETIVERAVVTERVARPAAQKPPAPIRKRKPTPASNKVASANGPKRPVAAKGLIPAAVRNAP